MKRTVLLIATMLFITALSAQSLQLKDKEGGDITGTTIDMLCTPSAGYASFKLDVLNIAASAKNVKVKKIEMSMLPAVEGLTICWVSCYPPFVFESPDAITIEPNQLCTNFEGDLTYLGGTLGTSTAKFVFFDMDNPNDSSYVIVNFNIGYLGKAENLVKSVKVSNAYPNPATSVIYFDYKLPVNTSNAQIKVSNLLGNTVSTIELTKNEGKAEINVSDLKNGVYFYTVMVNNSATVTRKLVVKR